jgi:hypothetical protein
MFMPLTITGSSSRTLPSLEALVLQQVDLPGYRLLFTEREHLTNDAIASRMPDPAAHLARLEAFGRVDGYAARFTPADRTAAMSLPIVVDSSVARFTKGSGALQALTAEESGQSAARSARLFPRNIADNTECIYEVYEEDGAQFALYRVDFRLQNVLGSVGAVWRRPRGGPLDALEIAERQVKRIRAALAHALASSVL